MLLLAVAILSFAAGAQAQSWSGGLAASCHRNGVLKSSACPSAPDDLPLTA
jgi:hypothetical protein